MLPTAKRVLFRIRRGIILPQAVQMRLRAKREARRAFSNLTAPPILIYQMGKVGSTTVYDSLRAAALPNAIFHLHFISGDFRENKKNLKAVGIDPPPYHFYLGDAVRKVLPRPCKIISLVRDPIAVVVSGVFQNPYFANEEIRTATGTIDHEKALKYLESELSDQSAYSYVNDWFDREPKQAFGIDVFSQPFPVNVGYTIYGKADVEALVIRLEDLVQKGPKAISDFLNLEKPLVLKQGNARTESRDGEAYQHTLKKLRLNELVCREIYSSKFVRHFYSETMIEQFISKWTHK